VSQQINLFNPIFLKQKKYFSAVTMAQSLGMILLGLVLVMAYADYQLTKLKREEVAVTAQLSASQTQLARLNAEFVPRQKSKALENEILKSESDISNLQQVFETLRKGEFGNTKGYSAYMRAYSRQIVGGLWLTGFSIYGAGNEIEIKGRATRPELIPAYINRLKGEAIMQGKTFAALEMRTPEADQPSAAGSKPSTGVALANFIEFNLQSSTDTKDSAATASGANAK
jgi:Tfp pilus assembly protein PilN